MDKVKVNLSGREIALVIRRHPRARRITLRLSPARDGVVMTLPRRASLEAGMRFFTSKSGWVLANVESDAGRKLDDGHVIPVLGQEVRIRRMPGRGVAEIAEGELRVYCAPEFTARRVRDFLKKLLQEECRTRAEAMAATLGKTVKAVRVRDTSSRWGSCSARGGLTFSSRLIFAPLFVLEYLVAHEVAHLAEMNHSRRFWVVAVGLCPEHLKARRWLARNGHTLHRFD